MTSYAVVIERADDGGYGAWCPDLPGCVALADTEEGVLDEMRQAMEFHLAGLREDGQPIPHRQRLRPRSSPSTRPEYA
jgi:predicted RNase H-like HicB family nuclease